MVDRPADDAWFDRAACAGVSSDVFFPTRGEGKSSHRSAKMVCAGCGVTAECLAYSLTLPYTREFGVWGGLSPRERRGMRRSRGD